MTGFKGEEGQNPSGSHTKKRHVLSEYAERQQRTCPSVHVPIARQRRRGGAPLSVSHMLLPTPMKSANSCTSDSAEHHLTSMAATERLNPIVTWPPSAKGHHDAMVSAGEKELADCPRPAELGRPTFVLAGHSNLYLFDDSY